MWMLFRALLLTAKGANTQTSCVKSHVDSYYVVSSPVPRGKEPIDF